VPALARLYDWDTGAALAEVTVPAGMAGRETNGELAVHYAALTAPITLHRGTIYLVATALVLWLLFHLWRNVRRFRGAARSIRLRDSQPVSFGQTNSIPELTGVAEDFDSLVEALTGSQRRIKEAAEENSHALKTPLAVIAQSMEPIKRALPQDGTAARSVQLIERSVAKLDAMVSAQRDLDQVGADLIYPMRHALDLSRFLRAMLPAYEATLAWQGKRLVAMLDPNVAVFADEDVMEPVVENLLENAASFTPDGGLVEVFLNREDGRAVLRVLDQGPGVRPRQLPHIFERNVSFRDGADAGFAGGHQGLGLWIVKRNVEGLGGNVAARNLTRGGFEVMVTLPSA